MSANKYYYYYTLSFLIRRYTFSICASRSLDAVRSGDLLGECMGDRIGEVRIGEDCLATPSLVRDVRIGERYLICGLVLSLGERYLICGLVLSLLMF